jgi:predicted AAA+ superfamily ATPase
MRRYLIDKKEDIKRQEVFERLINVNFTREFVNAVIGPRRAGKTFFLYGLIKKLNLKDEDYLFVNFEDDEIKIQPRKEVVNCVQKHIEIYGKEPSYLFFDEIQNLEGWQSFVYSLVEKKRYFIFITGSSSKLLSREIATHLRGRSLNLIVFPFSFEEFLSIENFEIKKVYSSLEEAKIKNYLMKYMKTGGFPQVLLGKIDEKTFFREYINVLLYKDLIERYKIENPEVARLLLYSVIQSFSKEFSINKIYRQIKGKVEVSNKTLYQYSSYLEEILFSFLLRKFHLSSKKSLLSLPKIYVNDTGIASQFSNFSENTGRIMENLVFLELKKLEMNNIVEVFYWKDYQGREVDFVLKEGTKIKRLIQVTYASSMENIEKREITSLIKGSEKFKCENLLVITWEYEAKEKIGDKDISFVPLWRWLLIDSKGG